MVISCDDLYSILLIKYIKFKINMWIKKDNCACVVPVRRYIVLHLFLLFTFGFRLTQFFILRFFFPIHIFFEYVPVSTEHNLVQHNQSQKTSFSVCRPVHSCIPSNSFLHFGLIRLIGTCIVINVSVQFTS